MGFLKGRIWLVVAGAGFAALLWRLAQANPGVLSDGDALLHLTSLVLLLGFFAASGLLRRRVGRREAQFALAWAGIFAAIFLGYALVAGDGAWPGRLIGGLNPAAPLAASQTGEAPGAVELRRRSDGHFAANALVNGRPVRFLVDTGATSVALTLADAKRAGVDVDALRYTVRHSTANGTNWGAPVRLERIAVGDVEVRNVRASVLQEGLDTSLLGMSFLNRLESYEVRGGVMVLRP